MPNFLDFQKEIGSSKVRNVYFIMSSDGYFIRKAAEILREKLFGSVNSKENFFLKYGDEDSVAEIIDLAGNFSSLFSASKLLIVKRSEKLARKLDELLVYASKPVPDTTLLLCFDKEYIIEKKLNKELDFFDFSDLPESSLKNWAVEEFKSRECIIDTEALDLFLSLVPQNFDLIVSEIEKISTYLGRDSNSNVTVEILQKFVGYGSDNSPDQLMQAILRKQGGRSLEILDNLLNKGGVNEIFLLSVITNYYFDLISFKTRGFASNDSYSHFGKYKMWGERLRFAKSFHNVLNVNQLTYSLSRLLETDHKLKYTMLEAKTLMTALIEDLVNAN